MAALNFVDSHNMVAYLERPTDSDDFTEIVDFLNANPIRRDLQFADEDGTDCLPTTIIFENLKLMGYENLSDKLTFFKSYFSHQWKFLVHTILQCLSPKKIAWNLSSNIASAIICLATNQKFNFSKMVFDGMTRNLDSLSAKFLMYLRFLQVFLDKQLDKVPSHNAVYNAHCHTKKVFANMKRIGKDFSRKVTPLFDTMLIQHQSEVGDSLERVATTTSSLEAEQVNGNITKTRSKVTLNEPTTQGTSSGSGPRRQNITGNTIAQTRFENVSKTSYDSPLGGVKTPRSDEDTKEITSLKKRVKKLEQRGRLRTPGLKRLYKVRTSRRVESSTEASLGNQKDASKQGRNISKIDADVDISLVHEDAGIHGRFDDEDIFDTSEVSAADPVTTGGEVVTTASVDISTASVPITVSTATPTTPLTTTTKDDMTLAETLMEIKSAKPKAIGVVMQEPTKIEEEDRLARQREEEDNIVSWDNAQAMMEADYQMAERLQAEEQASLTDEEKARLFVQLLDARKKHFAALRA
ncbi:hypothetical protein Tco_0955917 [Tanacetum coccineum]|uniref:Synaptobrevin, longin-like domain protein n=1 Tax=Tanacetum coccineum TaxID=301880 RepID=A0ABQ5E9C2_9ASTR